MPPLLQLSACAKSATICLLSTDNCHLNVSLQTAVTSIAASLTRKCGKETNQNDTKWLLALLGGAVGSRSDADCTSSAVLNGGRPEHCKEGTVFSVLQPQGFPTSAASGR